MLRINALKRTCPQQVQRWPASPWICQRCRVHQSTQTIDISEVSFPPSPKIKVRSAAKEQKFAQKKRELDHQKLIQRLEEHIARMQRALQVKQEKRFQRSKTLAEEIVEAAKKLSTTPEEWPVLRARDKAAIRIDMLTEIQVAVRKTHGDGKAPDKVSTASKLVAETPQSKSENLEAEVVNLKEKTKAPKRPIGKEKEKLLEVEAQTVSPFEFELEPINVEQDVELRPLNHGLDRVLFNPGVTFLRDPRSKVYNFDPYLDKIMPVDEFDFDALGEYIMSSRDDVLIDLARKTGKKYVGSTSSMTSILSHLHYLISRWRPLNLNMLSKGFVTESENFTKLSRLPVSVILRYKDGVYAIDQDTETDSIETILLFLGRSMEKMLTLSPEVFDKYHRSKSHEMPEEVKNARERYHYTTFGDLLFRSQLDAHDDRLPGTGVFDLKTRAVVSVRMSAHTPQAGWGYQIKTADGQYESFEREYYDLIRAAFMKYSLQVRMGRMDGCFVAYHNTKRIFGFQYISIDEMDEALHGSSEVGDQEFRLSLKLLNEALDRATQKYPEQSLRLWFETRESSVPFMYFAAEPLSDAQVAALARKESDLGVVLEQINKPLPWEKQNQKAASQDQGYGTSQSRDEESDPALSPLQELITEGATGDASTRQMKEETEQIEAGELEVKGAALNTSATEEVANLSDSIEAKLEDEGSQRDVEIHVEDSSDSTRDAALQSASGESSVEETLETTARDSDEAALEELEQEEIEVEESLKASSSPSESPAESTKTEDSNIEAAASSTETEATVASDNTAPKEPEEESFLQVVVTQNFVNGAKVDRPRSLGEKDIWTLNYAFLDMGQAAASKTMKQIKKRKDEVYDTETNWRSGFFKHLIQLSREGEDFSEKRRKEDEEGDIVVYRRKA